MLAGSEGAAGGVQDATGGAVVLGRPTAASSRSTGVTLGLPPPAAPAQSVVLGRPTTSAPRRASVVVADPADLTQASQSFLAHAQNMMPRGVVLGRPSSGVIRGIPMRKGNTVETAFHPLQDAGGPPSDPDGALQQLFDFGASQESRAASAQEWATQNDAEARAHAERLSRNIVAEAAS